MSDRIPLRHYLNSRAVLIGTAKYRNLNPVPAAANSLRRMAGLLKSDLCGWPADRVIEMADEPGPGDLHNRLILLFREVSDVAMFYFAGHGQPDDRDQLCLGLVNSSEEPDLRASTSLEFSDVRDALIRSPAKTKILILDCCFSGLASERENTLGPQDVAGLSGGTGAYTMAACHPYGAASFETGGANPQTYFTKYFVDVVEAGIPGEPARLPLRSIFLRLTELLEKAGHPQPTERNVDSASDFVLAYNAAPVQGQTDVPDALQQIRARLAWLETSIGAPAAGQANQPRPASSAKPAAGARARAGRIGGKPGRTAEQLRSVASLHAQAAEFLRTNRGEDFRAIEEQLQQLGSSARPTAVLQTSLGTITIQLLPDYTPEAVRNFIELADGTRPWLDTRQREPLRLGARLYDATIFHRVVRDLMIHGGDPTGTGAGGPGYLQAHELHGDLAFDQPYRVAMASSESDSDGSQFFITVAPAPWLSYKHTIFGLVTGGSDVAHRISEVPVDAKDRPVKDVVLRTVRIGQPAQMRYPGSP